MYLDNNTSLIKTQASDYKPGRFQKCRIRKAGRYVSVKVNAARSVCHIRKLSADEYVHTASGEIKKFDKNAKKGKKSNLKRTFSELSAIIRANFSSGTSNQLFLTLTYAENMTDRERLMKDWEAFYKRLKRAYSKHKFEYVTVAEPQARGAWHLHVLLKSNLSMLYISNQQLELLWSHGYTDAQRLKSNDVGAYYTAYFTDLLADANELGLPESKRRIKGGRLHMYPPGMKLYRCSCGIVRPEWEETEFQQATYRYYTHDLKKAYECAYDIIKVDEAGEETVINRVYRAEWKPPEL